MLLPNPANQDLLKLNFGELEKSVSAKPELKQKLFSEVSKKILTSVFGNSPYLSSVILSFPEFFIEIIESGFENAFRKLVGEINAISLENKEKLYSDLRLYKRKFGLLIALGEITHEMSGAEAMEKLSQFADICVELSSKYLLLKFHNAKIIKLKNEVNPFEGSGLVVIAIGKLGSYELNYSSDIDISVFYEDNKIEYLGRKTPQQFYIEFAQELTDILSRRTSDGYVFRVDMRLRPDPASNPLAVSLEKAEKYYFTVGQNWERAAMIKARLICGDVESNAEFFSFMDKNVWRKSLDFETIEDIHSIKRQIDTRQGMHPDNLYGYNLKIGRGGIREIEFYVQTQQLIWGGRKPILREKKTVSVLYILLELGEIKKETADELADAYNFLRKVEHRLQMINDEQTHKLPNTRDKMEALAIFCNFDDEKEFVNELLLKIETVRSHYSKLFETSPSLASDLPDAIGSLIFTGAENHPDTIETLSKMGFYDANMVSDIVRGWHHGRYNCTMKKRSRAVLTKLMPAIISTFAKSPDPDMAFIRFDKFLSRLPEGSQIFSMLYVNPSIMELLAEVMGGYPEIAENLSRNTALLDYVLAPEFYDTLPDLEDLEDKLQNHIANIESLDEIIEAVKDWANDRKFRVGVQFIKNELSSEDLFLALSNIAEAVIKTLIKEVGKDFERIYGKTTGGKFACIVLGKFGSRELTFQSDLDIFFIYDFSEEEEFNSNIDAATYYIRLANKIVFALSAITRTGRLYEVDLRLRPLGESGPIATSFKTFDEYYNPNKKEGSAWVWEYMTLTRARVISVNEDFQSDVSNLITKKLTHKWDSDFLQKEAGFIYKKFREHRNKKKTGKLDVKNSTGGIFDLEFMLRFLQLKNMFEYPDIYSPSTVQAIKSLGEKNVINDQELQELQKAFNLLTNVQNILRITSESKVTGYTEDVLCKITSSQNMLDLNKKLEFAMTTVKNLFNKYLNF